MLKKSVSTRELELVECSQLKRLKSIGGTLLFLPYALVLRAKKNLSLQFILMRIGENVKIGVWGN